MKRTSIIKAVTVLVAGATIGYAFATVSAAVRPLCGPTILWTCSYPNCPDCPEILFAGTVCEKAAYERRTGRTCVPE